MPIAKRRRKPQPAPSGQIYQLEVTLRDVKVPIWRTVQVPGEVTLSQLHEILQLTMGWQNSHLYEFRAGGVSYGEPNHTAAPKHVYRSLQDSLTDPRAAGMSPSVTMGDVGDYLAL